METLDYIIMIFGIVLYLDVIYYVARGKSFLRDLFRWLKFKYLSNKYGTMYCLDISGFVKGDTIVTANVNDRPTKYTIVYIYKNNLILKPKS